MTGRRHRYLVALGIVLFVTAVLGAGGFLLYDAGLLGRNVSAAVKADPASVPPPPGLVLPEPVPASLVLSDADGTPPRPGPLRQQLAEVLENPDLGDHIGVLVEPLAAERELLRVGGDDSFVPASMTKLLTALAALETIGPGHRFTTTVVRVPRTSAVTLVGGGDPLLASTSASQTQPTDPRPATLRQLAARTVRALRADGVRRVRLAYDTTLFAGPAVSPTWEADYVPNGVVAPVTALWDDQGSVVPGSSLRHDDPAQAAAETFATYLERGGVAVRGQPASNEAPATATEVAAVSSPPLVQIVEHLLASSDNESAEVVLRHIGLATGRVGSFDAGAAAVRETLVGLGVDLRGVRLRDGSGLSHSNRLTLEAVADVLRVASDPDRPQLRPVVSGLPVAGFTGTLAFRFVLDADAGLGVVRAKTGTLSRVHALAGVVLDRNSAPLILVAIVDRVDLVDTLDARALLDQLAALLAACGCG